MVWNFGLGIAALAILIVLPAWSLNYWQGWVFIAVFAIATNLIGVYLALKDPVLLERRKRFGPGAESRGVQKMIAWLAIFGSAAMLVVFALDYRFGWSRVPPLISLLGDMLVVLGLLVDWFVLRENSFGSSTIEAVEGQKVISTGPYALVRHPMYVGVLIMLIGVPPALGSWWGLLFLRKRPVKCIFKISMTRHGAKSSAFRDSVSQARPGESAVASSIVLSS